jgi:hypothetical protein
MKLKPETLAKSPEKYDKKMITVTARLMHNVESYEREYYNGGTDFNVQGYLDLRNDDLVGFWYIYCGPGIDWELMEPDYRAVRTSEGRDVTLTGRFDYSEKGHSLIFVSKRINERCRFELPYGFI